MTIALSQNDRQCLEKFVSRKMRPTSRQKAQALLGFATGEAPERLAKRVGMNKDDLTALVNQFTAGGLDGVGLGSSRTKGTPPVQIWVSGEDREDCRCLWRHGANRRDTDPCLATGRGS